MRWQWMNSDNCTVAQEPGLYTQSTQVDLCTFQIFSTSLSRMVRSVNLKNGERQTSLFQLLAVLDTLFGPQHIFLSTRRCVAFHSLYLEELLDSAKLS